MSKELITQEEAIDRVMAKVLERGVAYFHDKLLAMTGHELAREYVEWPGGQAKIKYGEANEPFSEIID